MDAENLTVRAELIDEMSAGIAKAQSELAAMRGEVDALNTRSGAASVGGLSALDKQLNTIRQSGNALGSQISDLVGWVGTKLVNAAQLAVEALGALGVAGAAWGLKVTASLQQSQLAMDTFLGSVSAGNAMFNQLKALQGPFSIGALTQGAQSLLTAGASPQQATALTKAIANIAAPQVNPNQAFDDISQAVNRIQETGRLDPRSLLAFMNSGVDAYGLLSQEMGVPRDLVRRMLLNVQKTGGDIAIPNTFLTDLSNLSGPLAKFQGGLTAQRATLGGEEASARIQIGQMLAAMSAPVASWLQSDILPKVTSWATGVEKRAPTLMPGIMADLGKGNTGGAADLISELVTGGPKLVPVLAPLLAGIKDLFEIFKNEVIPVAKDLGKLAVPALKDLDSILGFMASHKALTEGLIGTLVGIAAVRSVAGPVTQLAGAFSALKGAIGTGNFLQAALAFLKGLLGFGGAGGAAGGIATGGGAASSIPGGVIAGGEAGAASAGGLGMLGTGLLGLGGGYALYQGLKPGSKGVGSDLETVGGTAALGAAIGSILPGIGTLAGLGIGAGVGGVIDITKHLFGGSSKKPAGAAMAAGGDTHIYYGNIVVQANDANQFAASMSQYTRTNFERGYQTPYSPPA